MDRAPDLRAWLHQAAVDVACLAESREAGTLMRSYGRRAGSRAWAEAGIESHEIPLWHAAGCVDPGTARELKALGILPRDLVDLTGAPNTGGAEGDAAVSRRSGHVTAHRR